MPRAPCAAGHGLVGYGRARTSSKNSSARGSRDCPSQNIACLRTAGFRLVRATSISFGTPFVLRQLAEGEHRAFLDLGLGIVLDGLGDRARRLPAGLLREPEDGLAAHGRAARRSWRHAVSVSTASGFAALRHREREVLPQGSRHWRCRGAPCAPARTRRARARSPPRTRPACAVAIGLSGAISVASARSAAGVPMGRDRVHRAVDDAVVPVALGQRHGRRSRSSRSMLADVDHAGQPVARSRRRASSSQDVRVGANALDLPVLDPVQHHGLARALRAGSGRAPPRRR